MTAENAEIIFYLVLSIFCLGLGFLFVISWIVYEEEETKVESKKEIKSHKKPVVTKKSKPKNH